jgi:hypothetical protein
VCITDLFHFHTSWLHWIRQFLVIFFLAMPFIVLPDPCFKKNYECLNTGFALAHISI